LLHTKGKIGGKKIKNKILIGKSIFRF